MINVLPLSFNFNPASGPLPFGVTFSGLQPVRGQQPSLQRGPALPQCNEAGGSAPPGVGNAPQHLMTALALCQNVTGITPGRVCGAAVLKLWNESRTNRARIADSTPV